MFDIVGRLHCSGFYLHAHSAELDWKAGGGLPSGSRLNRDCPARGKREVWIRRSSIILDINRHAAEPKESGNEGAKRARGGSG